MSEYQITYITGPQNKNNLFMEEKIMAHRNISHRLYYLLEIITYSLFCLYILIISPFAIGHLFEKCFT